jgi:hypothetical protein
MVMRCGSNRAKPYLIQALRIEVHCRQERARRAALFQVWSGPRASASTLQFEYGCGGVAIDVDGPMGQAFAMGRLRKYGRGLSWVVVIALVSSVLLAAFAPLPANTSTLVDKVLGPLVICTGHDGAPSQTPDTPAPLHCPICTLHKGFTLAVLVLSVSVITFVDRPDSRCIAVSEQLFPEHLRRGGKRSRAPPVFA